MVKYVKYVLLSLGMVGLLMLGQGLGLQGTWPTSQQERFVARVPQDFPTIQAAIDAVAEGSTVLIGPGTYKETIKITKSLRLVGAGRERVKIHPRDDDPLPLYYGTASITVEAKEEEPIEVYLAGFSLERLETGELRDGISLGLAQAIVQDVSISGYYNGLVGGRNVILSRVSFYRNAIGVIWSNSLTVHNSLFDDNGVGINSFLAENLEVRQSLFVRNGIAIAIFDWRSSGERELMGNVMKGNKVGLYLALGPTSDIQEELKAANQSELGPSPITMSDNKIVGNGDYGIALAHSGCLNEEPFVFYPFSLISFFAKQKVLVAFWERNNTIRNNGKGDLCPPDYPWPPGFRK